MYKRVLPRPRTSTRTSRSTELVRFQLDGSALTNHSRRLDGRIFLEDHCGQNSFLIVQNSFLIDYARAHVGFKDGQVKTMASLTADRLFKLCRLTLLARPQSCLLARLYSRERSKWCRLVVVGTGCSNRRSQIVGSRPGRMKQ